MKYKALIVEEIDGKFIRNIKETDTENLPAGEILVKVSYSSLNYKDALSATGNKGVTKNYPHTPGIDAAGIVAESDSDKFKPGDQVIVMGYDLGMNTPGGFGQFIRVPAEWVSVLPENLTLLEAMIIGTAGFTAGISVNRLTELVQPKDGKIIVSGATGGVGSVALAMLNKLGYQTVAISGKPSEADFLQSLGVSEIISRQDFLEIPDKPILSAQYAGAIDAVGGEILTKIIKSIQPLGAVTTCGSVNSTSLNLTVFPFILRGISLIGISAQNYPKNLREQLWPKIAKLWKPDQLLQMYNEISLEDLNLKIDDILSGKLKGRTVVKLVD